MNNKFYSPLRGFKNVVSETFNLREQRHSYNGKPAVVYNNGSAHWYKDNSLHREIGPAVIRMDGMTCWYYDGKQIE